MMEKMSFEKALVATSFIFVFMTFAFAGVFFETKLPVTQFGSGVTSFSGDTSIGYSPIASQSSAPRKIKAEVKGSIYETGSNMTVFGACFDGDSYLLPEANATFTAWYPNGTIMIGPNGTMDKIYDDFQGNSANGTGRWKIHVTMGDTIGTYLTEMRCEYLGEWAIALGEWQNPEWVQKIGNTYLAVGNLTTAVSNVSNNLNILSNTVNEFKNDTSNNFSTVIQQLNTLALNVSSGGSVSLRQFNELSALVHSVNPNLWILDAKNPFWSLASGTNNFNAVDMLGEYNVHAAGEDIAAYWDGYTWTYRNMTGYTFYGVSVLPASLPYAWYVGTDGANPVVSINGAAPTTPTLPGDTSTSLVDVKLFQRPNDPSGAFYGYLLANDGRVYFSNNSGANWTYVASVDPGTGGRMSEVIENAGPDASPDGYVFMVGQGSAVATFDDGNWTTYTVNGNVTGVSLLHHNEGYVLTHGVDELPHVYMWNDVNLTETYVIQDSTMIPTGIAAVASNDIWVVTRDPSTFFHFDGDKWDYSSTPYGASVAIIIGFGNNSANFTGGIRDVVLQTPKLGYAVGDDGLILKFENNFDMRFDELLQNLSQQLNNTNVNLTPVLNVLNEMNVTLNTVNTTVGALTTALAGMNSTLVGMDGTLLNMSTLLLEMNATQQLYYVNIISSINGTFMSLNQTVMQGFSDTQALINAMNASLQLKVDNILTNVTYGNLYMETTLFPIMNATYQNTLLILQQLGIIDAKLNTTIELQNQTLAIVNQTQQDVSELVNRSRRIRAWVTQ